MVKYYNINNKKDENSLKFQYKIFYQSKYKIKNNETIKNAYIFIKF